MLSATTTTHEKVVIIIPTYNEADVIENTIHQIMAEVSSIPGFDITLLVFDSASKDETQSTVSRLQSIYPKLLLKTEAVKSGLGSAYLQAMKFALTTLKADIIFEFDADLSHQPKYIKPMLEKIKTCDVVVGSRYVKNGSIPKNWAFHRKCFSVLGNYIARALLTIKYKDFTSGFRASRRQVLEKALPSQFLSNHYAYKLELLWLLHQHKAKIIEHPIEFIDREQGESKLPKNTVRDSLRVVFTLRYRELTHYVKMCAVGSLGMVVQFISYNLLREVLSPVVAAQIAVAAAIINNYVLNSKFTFKTLLKQRRLFKIKRLTNFTIYSFLMIYLQSYWLQLGLNYFGRGALQENLTLITGIGLASLLNYFTYSRHIWTERVAS